MLNSSLTNYQKKEWTKIAESNNGSKATYSITGYTELKFICSKESNISESTCPVSLITSNTSCRIWIGAMVGSTGFVYVIDVTKTYVDPVYCFLNSQTSYASGSAVYVYAR